MSTPAFRVDFVPIQTIEAKPKKVGALFPSFFGLPVGETLLTCFTGGGSCRVAVSKQDSVSKSDEHDYFTSRDRRILWQCKMAKEKP
jgi:hypothetical protein